MAATKRSLSTEALALLHAIRDRHEDAITSPAPQAAWQRAVMQEAAEFGPLLNIAAWFDCPCGGAVYRRYRRALGKLVVTGMVEASQADGSKLTNYRLSPAGERMIEG
jgi:hypothetical protein